MIFGFAFGGPALADGIGGGALQTRATSPRGTLKAATGPTTAVAMGSSIGYTTNAGPTLGKIASPFAQQNVEFAHANKIDLGAMTLEGEASYRAYSQARDANEILGRLKGSIVAEDENATTTASFAVQKSRDVEEELIDTSIEVERRWLGGAVTPFVRGEAAYLDYGDVAGGIAEFANQDDRDRLSARVQAGVIYKMDAATSLTFGAGVDAKRYRERLDDFGLRRDSLSVFPILGVTVEQGALSLQATYTPLFRRYEEPLFGRRLRHGITAQAELRATEDVRLFAAARRGLDETDFLIASAAEETVVLAGATVSFGKTSATLEAAATLRGYEDLDLLALERDDRKVEYALTTRTPLSDQATLTARLSHLDYMSSLSDVATDQTVISVGLMVALSE